MERVGLSGGGGDTDFTRGHENGLCFHRARKSWTMSSCFLDDYFKRCFVRLIENQTRLKGKLAVSKPEVYSFI